MIQNFESKTEGEDNEDENTRQGPGISLPGEVTGSAAG